jgi:hypothetical protein
MLWRHPFPHNPYYQNARVRTWIEASIMWTLGRQHRDGAFDSVGPFTRDHGVTMAMVHALCSTARLLGPVWRDRVCGPVARACDFAARSTEDYAFISNHQALFALAWLDAAELLGEDRHRERASNIIHEILKHQSQDGWYPEYGGPDPGYESLGIFYLAQYWQRTKSIQLFESLKRSIQFFAHCVHPDGSIGGVYGTRHTSLYYPGGFEILASRMPEASAVARFLLERLPCGNVLIPVVSDAENLPSLMTSYLEAAIQPGDAHTNVPPLPAQVLEGMRHFPDSALVVYGTHDYYAVAAAAKGGVCRIFDKRRECLTFEDAGFVISSGGRNYTSQVKGPSSRIDRLEAASVSCSTVFTELRQELPTPAKYVVLRLLNLTVFRSLRLGAWIRKLILERLILVRQPGPFCLCRTIVFLANEIRVSNLIERTAPVRVESAALPRALTAIHMGSAKYFHASELQGVPTAGTDVAGTLNAEGSARIEFVVRFSSGAEMTAPQTKQEVLAE